MQNPPPVQTSNSSTGIDENVAALLSYIFGWVSGLIFFLIEKNSRLVRFHAMQSILLNAVALVVGIVLWFASIVVVIITSQISGIISTLASMIIGLLSLAFFVGLLVAVVMCLIKAYQRQFFKLPFIGNLAEKFSAK